jgi:hypothetical protein
MKSCPSCNRTYPDDNLAFCLMDGSVLSAPYDPNARATPPATQNISSSRTTRPPATEVMKGAAAVQDQNAQLLSTIQAAPPQIPTQYRAPRPDNSLRSRKKLYLIFVAISLLLLGVLGIKFVFMYLRQPATSNRSLPTEPLTEKTSDQTKPACSHILGVALYDRWIQMGGESGKLGCPTTDETVAPPSTMATSGRWAQFAGGDGGYLILVGSGPDEGKVFEVTGCMFKLYASQGGTKSWLGFPLGDGTITASGARQAFESGYIVWDSKTSQCQAHPHTLNEKSERAAPM